MRRTEPVNLGDALHRLARDVQALRADVDRVCDLADIVASHGRTLDRLTTLVEQQTIQPERPAVASREADSTGAGDAPPPAWLTVEDPALAVAWLNELSVWLPQVWQPYLQTKTPDCWPWHPAVVAELLVVFHQWQVACLDDSGPDPLAAWHDRWRPGAARRTQQLMAGCERAYGLHKVISTEYLYDLARLDELAEWWATTHGRDDGCLAPGLTVTRSGR